jgi:nitrate reductase delta subunit
MMGDYAVLAEALRYPAPGRLEQLETAARSLDCKAAREAFAAFLHKIRGLSLAEWEELHTRTLDLNPLVAPYVGFQTWGESYQRGAFMSAMNRAESEAGVQGDGELPDHLIPILRYLDTVKQPTGELVEVLAPAVQRMKAALRRADADNPYGDLLDALLAAWSERPLAR